MPSNGVTAVLLISCRDQKGLVAATADFIFRDGGNIIHADQHTLSSNVEILDGKLCHESCGRYLGGPLREIHLLIREGTSAHPRNG